MSRRTGGGFSLIEVMVVVLILFLLFKSTLDIYRAGTRASLSGSLQVNTTLEARRILRAIRNDLKLFCLPSRKNDLTIALEEAWESGRGVYRFLSYPAKGSVHDVIPERTDGFALRTASRITLRLLRNRSNCLHSLIREELLPSSHPLARKQPGRTLKRVLSRRVNFFEIRPRRYGNQHCFWVSLQLVDSLQPSAITEKSLGKRITDLEEHPGILLADFYDVVFPDPFGSMKSQPGGNRNWHTVTAEP